MRSSKLRNYITLFVIISGFLLFWNFYEASKQIKKFQLSDKVIDLINYENNHSRNSQNVFRKDRNFIRNLAENLYGFNILKSQELSFARPIPDTRPPQCQFLNYNEQNLHPVSIIIPVFNEFFSVLVRTVYTVITRSPKELITEIILIDDSSTYHDTKLALDSLVKSFSKVMVHRLDEREGLIKAKIKGEELATSEIIIYLDSHTEVNVGWLEPLIFEVASNPMHKVVIPSIDIIDPETFEYRKSPLVKGGFNWGLYFTWLPISNLSINENSIEPIRTPTLSGGYFAMTKNMYKRFGGFDPYMKTWGGENLEMSFRIWQCGGTMEILPCSRVGHIFRPKKPYSNEESGDEWLENTLRMAQVWLDDYIEKFFKIRPDARDKTFEGVAERRKLREDLECSSFQWYLENVFPEMLKKN